jgi:hypothetical protein
MPPLSYHEPVPRASRGGVPTPTLRSAQPISELRPYVRSYAQRRCDSTDPVVCEHVLAMVEQMDFELGILSGVFCRQREMPNEIFIVGAQSIIPGELEVKPGVESFAI